MIKVFESRKQLVKLQEWLKKIMVNDQSKPVHTAYGKILVELDLSPKLFLKTNQNYDRQIVGRFCENSKRNDLAIVAFRKGASIGSDTQFLDITTREAWWEEQAAFLLERNNSSLWDEVLYKEQRGLIADLIINRICLKHRELEHILTAAESFKRNGMHLQMVYLLSNVFFAGSLGEKDKATLEFNVIKAAFSYAKMDVEELIGHASALSEEQGKKLILLARQEKIFSACFLLNKKFGLNVEALKVLVDELRDFETARSFAAEVNRPEVWKELARAYLQYNLFAEALDVLQKEKIATLYETVVKKAPEHDQWEEVVRFLLMAQKELADDKNWVTIERHLIYAYARIWPRRMPEFRNHVMAEENKVDLVELMETLKKEGRESQANIIDAHLNPPPPEPEEPKKKGKKLLA